MEHEVGHVEKVLPGGRNREDDVAGRVTGGSFALDTMTNRRLRFDEVDMLVDSTEIPTGNLDH